MTRLQWLILNKAVYAVSTGIKISKYLVFWKYFMIFRYDLFQYIFQPFEFVIYLAVADDFRYKLELEKSKQNDNKIRFSKLSLKV